MKAIITVLGTDKVGIIAKVCSFLADREINILDISQTIIQGYFNMMMIVEVNESVEHFSEIADGLEKPVSYTHLDVYKRQVSVRHVLSHFLSEVSIL